MPRWFIRTGCGNQAYQAGGEGPRLVLHDGAGRAGSQPLSREEMRRTWAVVDVFTSSKRRTKQPPPTAALIRRKYDALSLPALDTLCSVMVHTIAIEHGRFSPSLSDLWHGPGREMLPGRDSRGGLGCTRSRV